jgi:selenocysteine lyase/cysteine desulfurase
MLTCQRSAFQLPEDQHYLNCAYMSPLLAGVEEAGIAGIRRKRNPAEIAPRDFFEGVNQVREQFAALIGAAEPNRIAVMPSASYGLTTAARNLPMRGGDSVVVASGQMPSNVYCWRRVAGEAGANLVTVDPPAGSASFTEAILEAIDDRTAIVALGTVHWFDGRRLDLDRIAERTRQVGARLVLDGTQSVGAVPFDVERIRPAALVVACYKWLLGPYSVTLAWFGPEMDHGVPLEETWLARPGSEDFGRLAEYRDGFRPGAARYDVGETSNFVLMPMVAAGLERLASWTVPAVAQYCERLTGIITGAAADLGYAVGHPDERSPHISGVRLASADQGERLQDALRRRRVSVSVRGDAVRISPHVYNDEADAAALVSALEEVRVASR